MIVMDSDVDRRERMITAIRAEGICALAGEMTDRIDALSKIIQVDLIVTTAAAKRADVAEYAIFRDIPMVIYSEDEPPYSVAERVLYQVSRL